MTAYRVATAKVEYRVSGVLTTAYYGEVIQKDESTASRLVEAGSLVAVPADVPS